MHLSGQVGSIAQRGVDAVVDAVPEARHAVEDGWLQRLDVVEEAQHVAAVESHADAVLRARNRAKANKSGICDKREERGKGDDTRGKKNLPTGRCG